MLTASGTIHHVNGTVTSFLIDPQKKSWTQWGGTTMELGAARDYVHAMSVGLAEHSNYFAADAPVPAPAEEDEADAPAQPAAAQDEAQPAPEQEAPEAPTLDFPAEDAYEYDDDEPSSAYVTFADLAADYAREKYGKSTGELPEETLAEIDRKSTRLNSSHWE